MHVPTPLTLALTALSTVPLALSSPVPSTPLTSRTTSSTLTQLHTSLLASGACKLPEPGSNCAGAAMKDVIIDYGKNATSVSGGGVDKSFREMMLGVAKTSGGKVLYDWGSFGFSAYIPEDVLNLMKAHGSTVGMKVHENACAEIPWCGEAPC
ncbi:hypothetical protein GQ43DRAFT_465020 [Delitschia confertaspora ATCC 74209]|uniref:Uncharacterized protein n=1 Tax=Delitschia confertaspora ATCC 74209 TaxID=1513339 RepID=A0A9P4JJ20_9PLEO|nr:hypothetical protein GQ43DRAFT_465020 [Delitschia confertaspora ATCC 74209]